MQYITVTYPQTASLQLQGYFYDYLYKVFLSSGDIDFPSLTAVDLFTTQRRVSSICPPFTAYEYPTHLYETIGKNSLKLTLTSFPTTGNLDVILLNYAGYTKLSDSGIVITNISPVPANAITTIDGTS